MTSEKNYVDSYIKDNIKKGLTIIQNTLEGGHPGKRTTYYSGYLHKDILDSYPGRTSKKIFKGYREFLSKKNLVFTQKKFDDGGYDYYVEKMKYVKVK